MFLSGKVQRRSFGEEDALCVGSVKLAQQMERFLLGRVHVAYGFGEELVLPRDMLDAAIKQATGEVDAHLMARYSEVTGFLWMEEAAKVGGHDLLEIFEANEGLYGALVVQRASDGALDLGTLVEEFEERGSVVHEASMDTGYY